ncbi:MAG: DNA-binding protein WhiA [Thermoclostridium sp.]|nr:DNA-binding protein WhiA [Thermoclostridium sp.]
MSFSSDIKDELARLQNEKACCQQAELAGLLRTGLMLREAQGEPALLFITEHASVSRLLFAHIKAQTSSRPEISGEKTARLRKHVVYRLNLNKVPSTDTSIRQFDNLGIHVRHEGKCLEFSPYTMKSRCCMRSYLRGGFLAGGSIISPDKSYHLEIAFMDKGVAQEYRLLMEHFQLKPKQITRKGYEIVYMKEGQDIVDFLNIIGAHLALMEMENVRILKDMRNQVNRIVNCETANLEKTVYASVKQVEAIRLLDDVLGLENLPPGLKEIARLRLENPEASLTELGKMLTPVLGKSGVNHRLRKLEKLASDKTEYKKQ